MSTNPKPSGSSDTPAEIPAAYQEVLAILGRSGDYKENVLKISVPRNDLKVTVAGISAPTAIGFGGWVGLTNGDIEEVMMGDLPLLQEEVNPVMSALLSNGLEVSALHNHFFWEEPRIFFMHIHGHGQSADMARRLKPALGLISHPALPAEASAPEIDAASLADIIGHKPDLSGAVIKFTIGRDDIDLREMGAVINSRMGLNTWAAFIGTDSAAAVAGDVAMLEKEVNPTLKVLRQNSVNVVAIHNHMLETSPNIIFLHYWGMGPAATLAKSFRDVVGQLGSSPRK